MKTQDRQTYCRCGAATRDGASTCESCLTELYNLLTEDVPWLDEQLDISIAGLRSVRYQPGHSSGGNSGVVLNQHASAASRRLSRWLDQWIKFCLDHDVRNSAPTSGPPHEKAGLTERAQWLSWRVDGLAWWPSAFNANSGLKAAVQQAHTVLAWKPPVRIFLGKCGLPVDVTDQTVRCAGDVYALPDDEHGHCRSCGQEHLVQGLRDKLERELDDKLCTAAEIAQMLVYLGAEVPRERVRKRINQWKVRGVVKPVPCAATNEDGEPRFRYGAIKARLAVEFKREESAS